MKKRKIVFGYWFYNIGALIMMTLSLAESIFVVVQVITVSSEVNPTIKALYYLGPFVIIGLILFIYLLGYSVFRFVIFTKDGIRVRCLWGTIRYLKWEEIKEVRNERFYISVQGGFTSGWYLFDDGVERVARSGIVKKNTHITIPANKRNKKIIEQFWQGGIKEVLKKD